MILVRAKGSFFQYFGSAHYDNYFVLLGEMSQYWASKEALLSELSG